MESKKMHIGIIVEPYEEREPSGLAYVTVEYARGIIERVSNTTVTLYSKEPFKLFALPAHVRNVIVPKSFPGKNWYFLKQYIFHKKNAPDVLVFNMPLLPFILPRSAKTVIFCHEVLYESEIATLFSRTRSFLWRLLAYRTVSSATVVCAATHAIAREIADTYGISETDVCVIPHGIRLVPDSVEPSKKFAAPYFVFVGRTKYKKNMHGTIEGFLRFKEKTGAPHLLCLAGRTKDTPYLTHWLSEAKRRGFGDAVIRTGYVPEPELLSILKGSTALVFCSLAEGFGLPVAEAMSMGIPVITSTIPVLAEVAGDAALLANPNSPDSIAQAMAALVQNESLRADLARKGIARARTFQWITAQKAFTDAVTSVCTQ